VSLVAPLRNVYVALAFVIGFGLAAASVLSALDLVQVSISGISYLDGSLPFSFSSHGYTPVLGTIALISGFAALRRRWHALTLACWFLLGTGVTEAFYLMWLLAGQGVVPEPVAGTFVAIWLIFPMLGLLLAARGGATDETKSDEPFPIAAQDKIRLRNTLVGLAVISYVWHVATLVLSPGATLALAYLRGTTETHLVLNGTIGVCTAILLLVGIVLSRKQSDRFMNAVLAFSAGFAFEGFLDAIDILLGAAVNLEIAYALQDVFAFAASCTALALSVQTARRMAPHVI
jgi:hypothetical protein